MNDTFESQVLSITVSQTVSQSDRYEGRQSHFTARSTRTVEQSHFEPGPLRCRQAATAATAAAASQPTGRDCEADPETDSPWTRGRPRGPHPPHGRGWDGTSTRVWDSICPSGGRLHVQVFCWMDATESRLCMISPETLGLELFSIALSQSIFQIISAQS